MLSNYEDDPTLILGAIDKKDRQALKLAASSASQDGLLKATQQLIENKKLEIANYCLQHLSIHPKNNEANSVAPLSQGILYSASLARTLNETEIHRALLTSTQEILGNLLAAQTQAVEKLLDEIAPVIRGLKTPSDNQDQNKTLDTIKLCDQTAALNIKVLNELTAINPKEIHQIAHSYQQQTLSANNALIAVAQALRADQSSKLLANAETYYQENNEVKFLITYGKYLEMLPREQSQIALIRQLSLVFAFNDESFTQMAKDVMALPSRYTIKRLINLGKYSEAKILCENKLTQVRKLRENFYPPSPQTAYAVDYLNKSITLLKLTIINIITNADTNLISAENCYKNGQYAECKIYLKAFHHQLTQNIKKHSEAYGVTENNVRSIYASAIKRGDNLQNYIAVETELLASSLNLKERATTQSPEEALQQLKTIANSLRTHNIDLRRPSYHTTAAAEITHCHPALTERCENAVAPLVPKALEALNNKAKDALATANKTFINKDYQQCEKECIQALIDYAKIELKPLQPLLASKLFPEVARPFLNLLNSTQAKLKPINAKVTTRKVSFFEQPKDAINGKRPASPDNCSLKENSEEAAKKRNCLNH